MDQAQAHFTRLLELLRQEKEEDRRQYLELVRQRPLHERVEQGYSWYPLIVTQTGFALGDKAFVVVERTTNLGEPHQLRSGSSVSLFTNAAHIDDPERSGIINFVDRNRMKIILNAHDVPDWIGQGLLGIDLMFDERSYLEMEKALDRVIHAKGDRLAELRDLLTGNRSQKPASLSSEGPGESLQDLEHLNRSQQEAIHLIEQSRDVAVIHGPPGTGKTTTLVAAIKRLSQQENTVLVTAPSNTAADLLTERLVAAGLNVVRVGNISRVDESIVPHTLEGILAQHPESKNIKKVKLQAAEYRRQARRFKRTFTAADRRERDHLKAQARDLEHWAIELEGRLLDQVLSSAQAITCTLVGAANPVLSNYKFRTCIIDEAAQALEPAAWIPILKCSRVVLAGDPFQLPPTVKSLDAAKKGLSKTLIERCLDILPERVRLLTVQYRMHQAIMNFSNQYFYEGALEAHDTVADRRLLHIQTGGEVLTFFDPVVFIDTAGTGFEEKINEAVSEGTTRYRSRFNPEEALLVREHLIQLLDQFEGQPVPSIGILSPYREQVNYLEEIFREESRFANLLLQPAREKEAENGMNREKKLVVNTIDGFQGQERDVIYISLVRSNDKKEIGFLTDYRRMNVAMTRARMLLVVIGDSATIGQNKFYKAFLDYCTEHGQWRTAWEFIR